MKLFFSLFTLFQSALFLAAQQTGGQSGGGTAPAGTAPAGQVPAQTTPAQTSPVQSPQSAPSVTQPGFSSPLDPVGPGQQAPQGISGREDFRGGVVSPGFTGRGNASDNRAQTPQGLDPADPAVPPLRDTLPPPIRNSFTPRGIESQVNDASGAAIPSGQSTFGVDGTRGNAVSRDQVLEGVRDDAFAQRFQGVTAAGVTQMAFPRENAMVTIVPQDGGLILRGSVGSEEQRQSIEKTIRQFSTAGFIDNQLEVTHGDGTSPSR